MSAALDFNRANLSERPINVLINELIERAEPPSENYRQYLGASAIGSECLRKVQFDWMCDPQFPARIKDIFARGHFFEEVTRQHLIAAGFKFAPARAARIQSSRWSFPRPRRRDHHRRATAAGVSYPVSLGTQVSQRQGLAGDRARRPDRALCGLRRAGLRSIRPISTSPTRRCSASSMPTPASACISWCRSTPSWHRPYSDRAVMVIEATRAGELLPRVTDDPDDWRCKMCSHRERCWR